MTDSIPGPGHNSERFDSAAGARIRSFLERVERLQAEKDELSADIRDIYAEAKGVGYDVKVLRKLVKLRRMDTDRRREEEELMALYKAAIGMD